MLQPIARCVALVLFTAGIAGLSGCKRGMPEQKAPPPPAVTVTKPVAYPVQGYYEYNGYLDSVEKFEARARVKGFLNEVNFAEGEEVKAGTLLYRIDPREYQANLSKSVADIAKAKADIANAGAQITLATAESARAEEAFRKGAAPKTDVDRAKATLAANQAQLDVAKASQAAAEAARDTAKLQLDFTEIRTPIDGQISRTLVTKGNLVGQNEPTLLTTVVSVDPLYVYFDVPERDLVEYQRSLRDRPAPAGTPQVAQVEVGVATEEGYPHKGVIDFRENRVDTGTGTVRLRGRVPNPVLAPARTRLLYAGLFARVRVPAGREQPSPVIPEDALMTGQEGRYVFVVGADNKVAKRTVTVGPQVYRAPPPGDTRPPAWVLNNPNPAPPGGPPAPGGPPPSKAVVQSVVAITKGLTVDDLVVVNGLQKARPGAAVSPEVWQFLGPPAVPPAPPAPHAPR